MNLYDVIIIGGGPAGLSAALVLARSRRNVMVCDNGKPRNIKAREMHGYLTRDGIKPSDFLQEARNELSKYNVTLESREIVDINRLKDGFEVLDSKGNQFYCKKVLIATGVVDNIPGIQGIEEMYGKSVHHCPYCDGWEVRDKALAVYAKDKPAYVLAFSLKTWSSDIVICTDGKSLIRQADKEKLHNAGIDIYTTKIDRLEGKDGYLQRIIFSDGSSINREAIFFSTGHYQRSDLAQKLGCKFTNKGFIKTNIKQQAGVDGVFVAGDADKDIQFVIVAAAEGARAAVAINTGLQEDERKKLTGEN